MTNTVTQLGSSQTYANLLPSAARIATPNAQEVDFSLTQIGGVIFVVNVTAAAGSGSVTPKIEGIDPYSEMPWPILAAGGTTQITATGTYVYKVHPAAPTVTLLKVQHAQDVVPPRVRFTLTHADSTNSFTYSVSVLTDGD